jgi:hypothetical protein
MHVCTICHPPTSLEDVLATTPRVGIYFPFSSFGRLRHPTPVFCAPHTREPVARMQASRVAKLKHLLAKTAEAAWGQSGHHTTDLARSIQLLRFPIGIPCSIRIGSTFFFSIKSKDLFACKHATHKEHAWERMSHDGGGVVRENHTR